MDAHVVLLARDDAGYANLCRLLTDAHLLGERGDPWVAAEQICAHAGGLTALLGPRSHPGRLAAAGRVDAAARLAAPFREAFGPERLRVAVEHRVEATRRCRDPRRCSASPNGSRSPAVATNPVRYLVPQDAFLADALECMRQIVPIASHHVTRAQRRGLAEAARTRCARCSRERPDLPTRRSRSPSASRSTSA